MSTETALFHDTVWSYYAQHGRHELPWRQPEKDGSYAAYPIVLSEMMLQQTQVKRVIPKFTAFLSLFPTVESLAKAELGDVLRAWQGLGYNRRAKYLWQSAGIIAREHNGVYPNTTTELAQLPGIGINTAGAICAYAYDEPTVFIETNIRTVYIYHFFSSHDEVSDATIRKKVYETLPAGEPTRQWYWALMDYGAHLKQTEGNLNKLSKGYVKQSTFQGSKRQVRGLILRMLSNGSMNISDLRIAVDDERLEPVLDDLIAEGLVHKIGSNYHL